MMLYAWNTQINRWGCSRAEMTCPKTPNFTSGSSWLQGQMKNYQEVGSLFLVHCWAQWLEEALY
jgi:hypothetical protein